VKRTSASGLVEHLDRISAKVELVNTDQSKDETHQGCVKLNDGGQRSGA
jgi:hypothetical protein